MTTDTHVSNQPLTMTKPIVETVIQAAARLGVTTRTINRRIKQGTLAAIKHPSPGRNGFINVVIANDDLSKNSKNKKTSTKVDTNSELARLRNQVTSLRAQNIELAARPCLACAVMPSERTELELALQHALLLLDGVDKSELRMTPRWTEWFSFQRERSELWATFNRLFRAQNAV